MGDHEEMIMRDNLKYTYAKYNTLSQRAMNMTYGKMWRRDRKCGKIPQPECGTAVRKPERDRREASYSIP